MTKLLCLLRSERAATAVEYGLIAALICIAALGSLKYFGSVAMNVWNGVASESTEAMNN